MLKKETKAANRAPHLRKQHIPGADMVDKLDAAPVGTTYHHEGPYDASLLARNTLFTSSPVVAVAETNRETLKATPVENLQDSLERHRPLDGVAVVPPGMKDKFGRTYQYEEGTDMMRELGGDYKRWPGVVSCSSLISALSPLVAHPLMYIYTHTNITYSPGLPSR